MQSIKENQYDSTHHIQCLFIGWGKISIRKLLKSRGKVTEFQNQKLVDTLSRILICLILVDTLKTNESATWKSGDVRKNDPEKKVATLLTGLNAASVANPAVGGGPEAAIIL